MRIVTPDCLDRPEQQWLVRLRPRADMLYSSQGRTVASGREGMISGGMEGLFCWQTRLLSRYRYLVENEVPEAIAGSNVEQHSWLGYYGFLPSDIRGHLRTRVAGTLVRRFQCMSNGLPETACGDGFASAASVVHPCADRSWRTTRSWRWSPSSRFVPRATRTIGRLDRACT